MSSPAPADAVRAQYEALPYPERNPEDEKERLLWTWPESLAQINHYCFGGRQDFSRGFRVLVAGGGTGDATIFLAEQLRDTDAELVYIDASQASLRIARSRAQMRRLTNVRFLNGSLLDLPSMGEQPFDYITCTGVLHHLEQPEKGLDALLSVLKPEGALNVLLYGKYGREAVYQLQDLLKMVNRDGADMPTRLHRAKALLASLPASHAWKRHRLSRDPASMPDAEVYDLFLHAQDRAYTVPEISEWFARAGLHPAFSRMNFGPIGYQPQAYLGAPEVLEPVSLLSSPEQAAIAELAAGDMDLHCFFATRSPEAAASLEDLDNVPYFAGGFELNEGPDLASWIYKNPGKMVEVRDGRSGMVGRFMPGKYTRDLMLHLDGQRSLREIFEGARASSPTAGSVSDREFIDDFRPVFALFNSVDGMLLRHKSVKRFPNSGEMVELSSRWQQRPQDMART